MKRVVWKAFSSFAFLITVGVIPQYGIRLHEVSRSNQARAEEALYPIDYYIMMQYYYNMPPAGEAETPPQAGYLDAMIYLQQQSSTQFGTAPPDFNQLYLQYYLGQNTSP